MGQSTLISNEKAHKSGEGKAAVGPTGSAGGTPNQSAGTSERTERFAQNQNVGASKNGENQGPTKASGKVRDTGDGTIEENVEEQAP